MSTEVATTLAESRPEWPEVVIVVLHWNNYEDTAKCLRSISEITYPNYRVIVVDNGSTDDSVERLQNEFEWCTFILNEENRGFSAGCNVGIKRAMQGGADYVLLLNNDVVVSPSCLRELVKTGESDSNIAAVGGLIKYEGSEEVWYDGGEVSPVTVSISGSQRKPNSVVYETGFITGAMMLLDSGYLDQEGYLNENYFFGMEDKELSFNALENGWKLLVNSNAKADHKVSSTSGHKNQFRYYHSTINRLMFSKKNLSWLNRFLFYIFFTFSRIIRFAQWLLTGRTNLIFVTLLAIRDYFTTREPKPRVDLI